MQTHEWEELLDGTAVGPWEIKRHGDDLVVSICTTVHDPQRFVGDFYGEWNARLAAAAPEAVAEVVRLRREIAAMRDHLLARIAVAPAAPVFNDLADQLTHILEGDTDE